MAWVRDKENATARPKESESVLIILWAFASHSSQNRRYLHPNACNWSIRHGVDGPAPQGVAVHQQGLCAAPLPSLVSELHVFALCPLFVQPDPQNWFITYIKVVVGKLWPLEHVFFLRLSRTNQQKTNKQSLNYSKSMLSPSGQILNTQHDNKTGIFRSKIIRLSHFWSY